VTDRLIPKGGSADRAVAVDSYSAAEGTAAAPEGRIPFRPVKLVIIATVPETVMSFLVEQIRFLTGEGFEVHVITSPGLTEFPGSHELTSIQHEVVLTRAISPFADLKATFQIWRLLRDVRPTIVQTRTPKAGLLGMIAAWLARVPIRIYTVDGLPILSQPVLGRALFAITDWLSCRLATEVLCVSRSVRRFMIANGFCRSAKARVLGAGHVSGVDVAKFNPARQSEEEKKRIRNRYGIPQDSLVIGYIGRLVPDKGIAELATAWEVLRGEFPQAHLLLCGYFEPVHPVPPGLEAKLRSDPLIHITGKWLNDMPAVYSAVDLCVLPTYREGLSTVAIECGAMTVPIVATRVPGCVDAIRDGVTGLLVEPRDAQALTGALRRLLQSAELRAQMGFAARRFVSSRFSYDTTSKRILDEYVRLMETTYRRHAGGGLETTQPSRAGRTATYPTA
jgi:glycosyltransferase involved in cell wall biosynthesis